MYLNAKTSSTIFTTCAAVGMSLLCIFGAASAFVPRETVKFQDLNIDSPAGVTTLHQRLYVAAQHVCYAEWDLDPVKVQRAATCANEAEARAVSQLHIAGITANDQMNTGRHLWTLSASEPAAAQGCRDRHSKSIAPAPRSPSARSSCSIRSDK